MAIVHPIGVVHPITLQLDQLTIGSTIRLIIHQFSRTIKSLDQFLYESLNQPTIHSIKHQYQSIKQITYTHSSLSALESEAEVDVVNNTTLRIIF